MKLKLNLSFVKKYNKFLVVLIGILGFSAACTKVSPMEYGTPSADFIITGIVETQANHLFRILKSWQDLILLILLQMEGLP